MTFSEKERLIYELPIGGRFADPLEVQRKLRVASGGRLNEMLDDYEGGDEVKAAVAEEELVTAGRTAFALPKLTPTGGVSDADVLTTLTHFLDYLSKPSEPRETLPISPPCTAPRG